MHVRFFNKFFDKLIYSMIQLFGIILAICVFSFGLYHFAASNSATAQKDGTRELSFKSVCVHPNDTLWSIARENYTEEYGSLNNYIKEIKRCNSLTTDHINAGSSLLVPIYIPKNDSGY